MPSARVPSLLQELQNDYNDLAVEARTAKAVGITGQISGLFASSGHRDVKDAAEAAQVALRSIAKASDAVAACRGSQEVIDAAVLGCSKSPRAVCCLSLAILQKLAFNGLLSEDGTKKAVQALRFVSQSKPHDDESIKLKLLQTCLTFLQQRSCIQQADEARQILATCFRLLSARNRSTIVNTASAIVRQAVALVFEHAAAATAEGAADSQHLEPQPSASPGHRPDPHTHNDASPAHASPHAPHASPAAAAAAQPGTRATTTAPPNAPAQASGGSSVPISLLREMCLMCRGHDSAMLECRALSATFLLDILLEVLRSQMALFRTQARYLAVMQEDVCGMLLNVLRAQLEADTEHVQVGTLRAVLSCVALTITNYGHLLATKTELFLQSLLNGVNNATHLAQQVLCMNALRTVTLSAPTVHFLHQKFDMKLDHQLRAISLILETSSDYTLAFLGGVVSPENADTDSVALVSSLWAHKMVNKNLSFEAELAAHVSTGHGGLYIVLLAIDTTACLLHSLWVIAGQIPGVEVDGLDRTPRPVDFAGHELTNADSITAPLSAPATPKRPSETGSLRQTPPHARATDTPAASSATGGQAFSAQGSATSLRLSPVQASWIAQEQMWSALSVPSIETTRLLLGTLWQSSLEVLVQLLTVLEGEAIVVHCLRALQELTTVAGVLDMHNVMLAGLRATCAYTLDASARAALAPPPPTPNSPPGSQELKEGQEGAERPGGVTRTRRRDGIVLSPKNIQAFRTVFNITAALTERLGAEGWSVLLSTLTHLDEVLTSPATTTSQKVTSTSGEPAAGAPELGVLQIATTQLFASLEDASDGTVSIVANTLCDLCASNGVSLQRNKPRCAALEHLADVVICNRHRFPLVWKPFLARVQRMTLEGPANRTAAMAALHRLVTALLVPDPAHAPVQANAPSLTSLAAATAAPWGADAAEGQAAARRSSGSQAGASPPSARSGMQADGEMQSALLSAVHDIYQQPSVSTDVRYGCVELVHNVLQTCGERLTSGWQSILSLLEFLAVSSGSAARSVRLGHECMELIVSDYLACLPRNLLRRVIHVEACYVMQAVDDNTCYAASLALWRAGDIFGRVMHLKQHLAADPLAKMPIRAMSVKERRTSGSLLATATSLFSSITGVSLDTNALSSPRRSAREEGAHDDDDGDVDDDLDNGNDEAADPWSPRMAPDHDILHASTASGDDDLLKGQQATMAQLEGALSLQECQALLLFVMECALRIAVDSRLEVRASGVKLLFDTMTRHGAALQGEQHRVWDMAFPLLMELVKNVQLSDEAHSATVAASASSRSSWEPPMIVHHSRDSYTKQWVHTLDKALRCWACYLRAMLPFVITLARFPADWATLLEVLQGLVCMDHLPSGSASRKVALAAMDFFSVVIAPHSALSDLTPELWRDVWTALSRMAAALASEDTVAHVSVRQRFVATVGALYAAAPHRFDATSYLGLLDWMSNFIAHPVSRSESWPPSFVPPLQTSVLNALPRLLPPPKPSLWPAMSDFLKRHLAPPEPASDSSLLEGSAREPSGEALIRYLWLKELSRTTLLLYKSHMPLEVRASTFGALVGAMKGGMLLRWSPLARRSAAVQDVARSLASDACTLCNMGLPAVHIAAVKMGRPRASEGLWETLIDIFRVSLNPLGTAASSFRKLPGESAQDSASPISVTLSTVDAAQASLSSPQDAAVEAAVLDCLSDTVLASAHGTTAEIKTRLVRLIDECCSTMRDSERAPSERLSHMSLRKLYVLCSRGMPCHGSQDSHVDVAKIALPLFLSRCEFILRSYSANLHTPAHIYEHAHAEAAPRDAAARRPDNASDVSGDLSTSPHATSNHVSAVLGEDAQSHSLTASASITAMVAATAAVHEAAFAEDSSAGARSALAHCALQVLAALRLSPVVAEASIAASDSVRALVGHLRHAGAVARGSASGGDVREQTHLLILYESICECARSPDVAVRHTAVDIMMSIGEILFGTGSRATWTS